MSENRPISISARGVKPRTWQAFTQAARIFALYEPNDIYDLVSAHDQIWAGPSIEDTEELHADLLRKLGWEVDEDIDRWTLYV